MSKTTQRILLTCLGTFLLCFILMPPATQGVSAGEDFSGEGLVKKVKKVTATGQAPFKGNLAVARTIALKKAQDEAIRMAQGSFVKVKQTGDQREVVSKSRAKIRSFSIADENLDSKTQIYTVTIDALVDVWVEPGAVGPAMEPEPSGDAPAGAVEVGDDPYAPLIQRYPKGHIDWDAGVIHAFGEGYIKTDDAKGRLEAEAAARADAEAVSMELVKGIRVNEAYTVLNRLGQTIQEYQLLGMVQGGVKGEKRELTDPAGRQYIRLELLVPLNGVKGLTLLFFKEEINRTRPPLYANANIKPDAEATGIIIDVSKFGSDFNPALFPTVQLPDGTVVYDLRVIGEKILKEMGMTAYVVKEEPANISSAIAPEFDTFFKRFASLFASPAWAAVMTPSAETTPAAVAKTRSRRRRGRRPITVEALTQSGENKTSIVLSEEDAVKLLAAENGAGILSRGNVTIVVDSAVGGIEGRVRVRVRKLAGAR